MPNYDCLIIGHNEIKFEEYVKMLRSMGEEHADYRDLSLNYIEYKGKPYRILDILDYFYYQDRDKNEDYKPFHNHDLLCMVIAYLGTYISRRGFTFDYVNMFQLEKDRLREKLETNKILTVVVPTTIYTFDLPILEIVSFVRSCSDTVKIIVGGPYIAKRVQRMDEKSLLSLFKYIDADFYVCSREGEQALVNIIKTLKTNGNFDHINNIAYRKDNGFIITPSPPEINSLEENLIDYSLFPREDVGATVNVRVSKGCPFSCAFCGFPLLRTEKYKYLSTENIKKVLDDIRDIGTVENLFFIDGTLNVPKEKFKDMLRMMVKEKYPFRWNCFYRCDIYDEELVELLKASNCEGVFLGLESANDTILKNMNKTARKKDYLEAIPLFKKAGITVFVSLIVGFPGETYETYQETVDFLKETEPDFYRPQLWYCDTVTPIWLEKEKYGLKGYHFGWSHDTMNAKTACELLEKSFFSLDIPIWVPDPGFNFLSLYYLKRRGMSIEKQKKFLKCFNAIVKEKLLYPNKKEISPQLLENLRVSCQYDRPGEPDMRPVELLAGSGCEAAEAYWVGEFGNGAPLSNPGTGHAAGKDNPGQVEENGDGRRLSSACRIEKPVLHQLQLVCNADLSIIILAAYSTLLLRLYGQEDTTIVTSMDEKEVFPVRLYPSWTSSFREFAQTVQQTVQQAAAHRLYALHILTNPLRMKEYGASCPVFATAYMAAEAEDVSLKDRLRFYPNVYQDIGLILRLIKDKNNREVTIQLRYSPHTYEQETIEKLNRYLTSILNGVSENPDILLKKIVLDPEAEKQGEVMETHAAADFNF